MSTAQEKLPVKRKRIDSTPPPPPPPPGSRVQARWSDLNKDVLSTVQRCSGLTMAAVAELHAGLKMVFWFVFSRLDIYLSLSLFKAFLWAEVGDGDTDHYRWQRPEDKTTLRHAYKVDERNPGLDVVGETAVAMAAASIVFRKLNPHYSHLLLHHAKQATDNHHYLNYVLENAHDRFWWDHLGHY
ncbi:hypothetical protein Q3G72_020567 [Acer saccharum]|nr:hypothetical protein Q3G72_020567 [Acer saccharum]